MLLPSATRPWLAIAISPAQQGLPRLVPKLPYDRLPFWKHGHTAILARVERHVRALSAAGCSALASWYEGSDSNGVGPPVLAQAGALPMASATTLLFAELALSTTVKVPVPLDVSVGKNTPSSWKTENRPETCPQAPRFD